MNSLILSTAIIHILTLVSPGPDFIIILYNSTHHGLRKGIACALGVTSGLIAHILIVIGLNEIIGKKTILIDTIAILGSFYLLYISYRIIKTTNVTNNSNLSVNENIHKNYKSFTAFKRGLITNLLNGKAILFFLSILLPILNQISSLKVIAISIYIPVISAIWFIFVANIFSLEIIRNLFFRYTRAVNLVLATMLIIFASRTIISTAILYFHDSYNLVQF